MKKSIILIGGGGHCKSCIDVIEQEGKYTIEGIVDLHENKGQSILGYPIIANDNDIEELAKKHKHFLITLGQIKSPQRRKELFKLLKKLEINLPAIISPRAYVSEHSIIGEGTIIMHNALINPNAEIGKNCIINSKALIEHDAVIEDNTHISTGAIINGICKVGKNCLIGSGVIIKHAIKVTQNTIVGAGAVVTKDINLSGTYLGIPAKKGK